MKSIYQIYESVILEAMSLEEIYEKFYKNDIKSLEEFIKINDVDPTASKDKKGKYLDWLIRKAFKNNPKRFFEDSYKIKEDLKIFDKNQRKIGKQIGQIKDYHELSDIADEFREKKEKGEITLSRTEIKKDIEKIFEDNDWLILSPKTEKAAIYYGKNTKWCTAFTEYENSFNEYNELGPLYILIDKKNNKKYQFHFQTEQYMDEKDKSIKDFHIFSKIILDKLVELAIENNNIGFINTINDDNIITYYKEKYKKEFETHKLGLLLIEYVYKHNLEKIKELVENGANINIKNNEALTLSSKLGYIDIVKYLVKNGANIKNNNDALKNAIESNNLDIIKYLIEYVTDINANNNELLKTAIYKGNLDIVKYLVDNGANINDEVFEIAIINKKTDIIKYLTSKGTNSNMIYNDDLIYAVKEGNLEKIKELEKKGANIHFKEDQLLGHAAVAGHLNIVKYLVEKGANINSHSGNPLSFAVAKNHFEIVKYLIKMGANIHAQNDNALIHASYNGNFEIVKYLIEHGANINADKNILTEIVFHGNLDIVKYLVERGINIKENKEILFVAALHNHLNIIKYLIDNGIQVDNKIFKNKNITLKTRDYIKSLVK